MHRLKSMLHRGGRLLPATSNEVRTFLSFGNRGNYFSAASPEFDEVNLRIHFSETCFDFLYPSIKFPEK